MCFVMQFLSILFVIKAKNSLVLIICNIFGAKTSDFGVVLCRIKLLGLPVGINMEQGLLKSRTIHGQHLSNERLFLCCGCSQI